MRRTIKLENYQFDSGIYNDIQQIVDYLKTKNVIVAFDNDKFEISFFRQAKQMAFDTIVMFLNGFDTFEETTKLSILELALYNMEDFTQLIYDCKTNNIRYEYNKLPQANTIEEYVTNHIETVFVTTSLLRDIVKYYKAGIADVVDAQIKLIIETNLADRLDNMANDLQKMACLLDEKIGDPQYDINNDMHKD